MNDVIQQRYLCSVCGSSEQLSKVHGYLLCPEHKDEVQKLIRKEQTKCRVRGKKVSTTDGYEVVTSVPRDPIILIAELVNESALKRTNGWRS